jgi:hypothetical protein
MNRKKIHNIQVGKIKSSRFFFAVAKIFNLTSRKMLAKDIEKNGKKIRGEFYF